MDKEQQLAEQFETHRGRLRAVAHRMFGSLSEADDAVQEAWIRVSRADTSDVENMGGWLTTVVARVCLNMLRARKSRHEESIHAHVPEPILDRDDGIDPEHAALLGDSVGLALLVVLETLAPAERVAFVLHDVFAVSFEEIAPIVGRSPTAARQLASRARRRVRGTSGSGGHERLAGTLPGGRTFAYDAFYQDIVDDRRIVASYDVCIDGRRNSVSLMTIELAPSAGGTRLVLTEQGAFLDGLDSNAQREEGAMDSLNKLGEYLNARSEARMQA